jgi:hypothetical protein
MPRSLGAVLRPRWGSSAESALLTLTFFFPVAAGCLSNEYLIPKDELMHQALMPPPARGQRVRVVQRVGDRRGYPVPVTSPPPAAPTPADETEATSDTEGSPQGDLGNLSFGDGDEGGRRRAPMPVRRAPPVRSSAELAGRPAVRTFGGRAGGGRFAGGSHLGATGHLGGVGHVVGGLHVGGGGGNGGDVLVVIAVIAIVAGVLIGVGLVGGEVMRFDGYVGMAPEQPIHIKDGFGRKLELPLAALSPFEAAVTVEAKVMDDEGYGIERLDKAPLDRTGGTFKLDSGVTTFGLGPTTFSGPAATIQIGYFVTPKLGLLANIGLGGATDDQGTIVTRHTFNLEMEALPLARGRLHAGGYADAGLALAGINGGFASGPAGGGGALVELDLTSRLALTLRAGASVARLDQAWSPAATAGVGLAVY